MKQNPGKGAVFLILLGVAIAASVAGKFAAAGFKNLLDTHTHTHIYDFLQVVDSTTNFGEVWESEAYEWAVRIENTGQEEIKIDKFRFSCNCLVIEPPSLSIPSGESREVKLKLDLTAKVSATDTQQVRKFDVSIAPVVLNEPDVTPKWWTIRGLVRPVIRRSNLKLDFGSIPHKSQPLASREMTIQAELRLDRLEASDSTGRFQVTVKPNSDRTQFTMNVEPRGHFPTGPFVGQIELRPVGEKGQQFPSLRVPLQGEIVDDIQASPPMVIFGLRNVGENAKESFTLRSQTNQPFQILSMETSKKEFSVDAVSSSEAKVTHDISVNANIHELGESEGKLQISIRDSDGQKRSLVVVLRYHGMAANKQS
jgi:hypothetical protein